MSTDELLTVDETATKLKLTADTVRRLLRDKELPGIKLGKREWRIPAKALEDFIRRALEGGGNESLEKPAPAKSAAAKSAEVKRKNRK